MNPFLDKPTPSRPTSSNPRPEDKATTASGAAHTKPRLNRSHSRIQGMTVGDVRQCFSQMRNTPFITANTTLWCGMSAGMFALRYLVNTAVCSRKKRIPAPGS